MYSVIMKNGKIINIDANSTDMCKDTRMLKLYSGIVIVGVFNVDNIIGWVKSDYMEESEDK